MCLRSDNYVQPTKRTDEYLGKRASRTVRMQDVSGTLLAVALRAKLNTENKDRRSGKYWGQMGTNKKSI